MSQHKDSGSQAKIETDNPGRLQADGVAWDSADGLALLLEAAPVAIVTTDQTGQILFTNTKFEKTFGYHRDEIIGETIEILLPDYLRELHTQHRADYMANLRSRSMGSGLNLVARHQDGHEFPIEVGLNFVKIQGEMLVISSIIDISIRKEIADILEQRVEARTREIERRQRVADGLRGTLAILNSSRSLDEILEYIVTQAVELLDHAKACAVYRLYDEDKQFVIQTSYGLPAKYIAQATVPMDEGTLGEAMLTRRPVAISNVSHFKGESISSRARRQALLNSGYHAFLAAPLMLKDEIYGALVLYYSEPGEFSTEEIDLAVTFSDHAALAIENARLRAQAEHAAVAAERSRLARDLHDSVTQSLFSASLIAEVLPRLWHNNRDEGERRLQELRELTRGALAEMRTLLLELRPSKLTDVEMGDLLRQLTEATIGKSRTPINLTVEGRRTLPPDVQVALYRIAQEALNNVAKHARANQATVDLHCQRNRVELSISDNGKGFIFKRIAPDNLGLTIMRERAEAIGAALEIKTRIGQGTQIVVVWED